MSRPARCARPAKQVAPSLSRRQRSRLGRLKGDAASGRHYPASSLFAAEQSSKWPDPECCNARVAAAPAALSHVPLAGTGRWIPRHSGVPLWKLESPAGSHFMRDPERQAPTRSDRGVPPDLDVEALKLGVEHQAHLVARIVTAEPLDHKPLFASPRSPMYSNSASSEGSSAESPTSVVSLRIGDVVATWCPFDASGRIVPVSRFRNAASPFA